MQDNHYLIAKRQIRFTLDDILQIIMEQIKLGNYKHYKGQVYKVIGTAYHSETLEPMVIYQGQYSSPKFGDHPIFVRPMKMFLESVKIDKTEIPRFKFME